VPDYVFYAEAFSEVEKTAIKLVPVRSRLLELERLSLTRCAAGTTCRDGRDALATRISCRSTFNQFDNSDGGELNVAALLEGHDFFFVFVCCGMLSFVVEL